eukprot:GILK01001841.1.p1 GENE.GILK01001841.1~~GILK01001841.1.p1  ORF type:complete len:235 (+),score=56.30 GILK01001841.1:50-706(+)
MPKAFGINSKSQEAREKKEAEKSSKRAEEQKRREDAQWVDDDKSIAAKEERKRQKELKQMEQVQRKQELRELADQEMSQLAKPKKTPTPKEVTRATIAAQKHALLQAELKRQEEAKRRTIEDEPLERNINHLLRESEMDEHHARGLDEAISALVLASSDGAPGQDRHPEKRLKAAYASYEEANMPILKAENPGLKLSQLKQLLFKQWSKSPENPLNQR